jgi:hypothetical protein
MRFERYSNESGLSTLIKIKNPIQKCTGFVQKDNDNLLKAQQIVCIADFFLPQP